MATQDDLQSGTFPREVVSPFAQVEATLRPPVRGKSRTAIWAGLGIGLLILGGVGGTFLARYLNDPLRTMEAFPAGKYFENYHALAGSRFKGELRVEADLGWKEGVGRLMLFSTPSDSRSVAVMIPAHLASLYFVKGQTYLAELEVKEGGLVYASSCRKN